MATRDGVRLLEYNARFGDPEALNVLSLLKTDLVDICEAIIEERLDSLKVEFETRASVCKYVVPEGYPDRPVKNQAIDLSRVPPESDTLRIYHASLNQTGNQFYLGGSRALGLVGLGTNLKQAEAIAEEAASAVGGPVFHRKDIGTRPLLQKRIDHMRQLRAGASVLA